MHMQTPKLIILDGSLFKATPHLGAGWQHKECGSFPSADGASTSIIFSVTSGCLLIFLLPDTFPMLAQFWRQDLIVSTMLAASSWAKEFLSLRPREQLALQAFVVTPCRCIVLPNFSKMHQMLLSAGLIYKL